MATYEGPSPIEPAPLQPQSQPSASSTTPPPLYMQEEHPGGDGTSAALDSSSSTCLLEYYDVMILGYTGMGKSTTSDKIIIAEKQVETRAQETDRNDQKMKEHKLTIDDLTFWTVAPSSPDNLKVLVRNYLKTLNYCRTMADPHLRVNAARMEQELNPMTASCQLVSNELTKIRVLDVPGFFGDAVGEEDRTTARSTFLYEDNIDEFVLNHLKIMRHILRIQSTMKTVFRRILYFLPGRGPLQRSNQVLKQDIALLAKYFGPSIFESVVIVVTVEPRFSGMLDLQDRLFTDQDRTTTVEVFGKTLASVLSSYKHKVPINPPVVFISLLDTGESIVKKITEAEVKNEFLELSFDPGVCIKCCSTILWLENEKVKSVPAGRADSEAIPYDEGHCHPIFLPKNRLPHKVEVEDGVKYVVLRPEGERRRWSEPLEEVCYHCKEPPGSNGCWKIDKPFFLETEEGGREEIVVDHTNRIERHRMLEQQPVEEPEDEANHEVEGVEERHSRARGRISEESLPDPSSRSAYVSEAEDVGAVSEMAMPQSRRRSAHGAGPNTHRLNMQDDLTFENFKG